MKEGFYLREHPIYGIILYEYRYGILSYYGNNVNWTEDNNHINYQFEEFGWFLSKNKNLTNLEFLEDL